jgi:hypothetical protein
MSRDGSRSWAQRQHTCRDEPELCPERFRCGPEFGDSGGGAALDSDEGSGRYGQYGIRWPGGKVRDVKSQIITGER